MSKKAIVGFIPSVNTYTGPGDVKTSAIGWWGLRSYSAATAGGNCLDILRASDSTTQTFTTLADGNLDLANITTFLTSTTGKVTKLYDQTGNGHDLTATDTTRRPDFTFNAIGSLPGITYTESSLISGANTPGISLPMSFSFVGKVTVNTGQASLAIWSNTAQFGYGNAGANTWFLYGGSVYSAAATDNVFHAAQAMFLTSTTGNLYIDGTDHTGNPGNPTLAANQIICVGSYLGGQFLTGVVLECGCWGADLTSVKSTMNTNQQTYWGY